VSEPKKVVLLGATGSIGKSALRVLRAHPDRLQLVGLSAHSNAEGLFAIAEEFGVEELCLSGNASEWVHDWHFPEYYLFSPKENPQGPEKGQYKIIRGGNWRNSIEYVDLTYRNATTPRMRNTGVGFRCAKNAS